MRHKRRHRGSLVIELLVAGIMSCLIGAALIMQLETTYNSRSTISGQNITYAGARAVLDTLADRLRNAQQLGSGSYPVMLSAAASDITIYTNSTGDTARYWRDTTASPAALKWKNTVSGVSTTTTVLSGVTALTFTYYVSSGGSYNNGSGSWQTTASPNAPTVAEIPNVGAIDIAATVNINGYSRTIDTFVRLRNSPHF